MKIGDLVRLSKIHDFRRISDDIGVILEILETRPSAMVYWTKEKQIDCVPSKNLEILNEDR